MNADPRPVADQARHLYLQAADLRRHAERGELYQRTASDRGPDVPSAAAQTHIDAFTDLARRWETRAARLLGLDRYAQRRTLEAFTLGDRVQTALTVENTRTPEVTAGQIWDAQAAITNRARHAHQRAQTHHRPRLAIRGRQGVADRER